MKIKLFFLFLFTGYSLFADPSLCECDSCVYIRRPDNCQSPPPPPSTCAYNAPVKTSIGCMWKAALQGSFVYFEAKQDNMQLALKIKSDSQSVVKSNVIETDWNYNTGFKVKGVFYFLHDSWDLTGGYLNFHNSYSTDATAFDLLSLTPYFYDTDAGAALTADSLDSKWKLDIDLITGEIGRKYYVGRNLFIRTFFGAEGGWIDQKLFVNYNTTQTGILETIPYEGDSCNWCAGPRLGIQTEWETSCFFKFIADGSISVLYTEYDNKYLNQTIEGEGTAATIDTNEVRFHNMCFLRPHLNLLFGVSWGNYVHCNSWFFDVLVGYEANVFFDQNPFGKPDDTLYTFTNGNLYLHGLVISATVEF